MPWIQNVLLKCRVRVDWNLILLIIMIKITTSAVARPNGQPRQAGVPGGVRGHAPPPREILNFSLSEMRFAAFSGPFGNFFSS